MPRSRIPVTHPHRSLRDEVAFWKIADALAPEDSDLWVQIHNRRDPVTYMNTPEDAQIGFMLLKRSILIDLGMEELDK